MGGWVGGWVEEEESVSASRRRILRRWGRLPGVGGWVGGWVVELGILL